MKNRVKIVFILSLVFIVILLRIISLSKWFIENIYSRIIYKKLAASINNFTSLFNFSLGEILLLFFILLIIVYFIIFIKRAKNKILKILGNFFYNIICLIIIIYIIFLSVWGLNYYRVPLIENYSLYNNEEITNDDIYMLAEKLIKNINNLKDEMRYK